MPATPVFPYPQLIGGGPTLKSATFLEGTADTSCLRMTLHTLDGTQLIQQDFIPVA